MNGNGRKSELTPELKCWLDRVVVPALVQEYLAEHDQDKPLAPESEFVVQSAVKSTATAEED